jgi:predicted metal-dependent phosphoesterase TrpH
VIIDLHVHTRHYSGCSDIEAPELLPRARRVGLAGIVLTEHHILWPEEKLAPLRDAFLRGGVLLLAGQEVTCFQKGRRQGDFLVFGAGRSLGGNRSAQEMIRIVHGEGGAVVAAHPFKPSRLGAHYYGAGEEVQGLDLDGLELYHPDHDGPARERVRMAAARKNIPMTGGSDAHEIQQVGNFATRFEGKIGSLEDLVRELRAGRIQPVDGVHAG